MIEDEPAQKEEARGEKEFEVFQTLESWFSWEHSIGTEMICHRGYMATTIHG